MNKLSKSDEKCVLDALQECAAATKHIEDKEQLHKTAYAIFKKHIDKPALIKRACEGYNSAKSLYKLSSLGDGERGESFCLLDAPRMYAEALEDTSNSYVRKVASAYGYNPAQFYTDKQVDTCMNKAASAEKDSKDPLENVQPLRKYSSSELRAYAVDSINNMEQYILKAASILRNAERQFTDAREQLISAFAVEPKHQRKEAADLIGHAYGDFGRSVIELFNAARPLQKVAASPARTFRGSVKLPDTELTRLMAKFASANKQLIQARDVYTATMDNAVGCVRALFNIHKEASVILPTVVGGGEISKGFLGAELAQQTPDMLGFKSKPMADLRDDINSAELLNNLREHGVKRAFMDIITDDTVARYPLSKVQIAFNDSLAELPLNTRSLPSSAYTALLKSRVLARLGRNNAASAADTEQIQNTQNVYGKLRAINGELQSPQTAIS